jgi:hypothetical protein
MNHFIIGIALTIALAGPALAGSHFYVAPTASTPQTADTARHGIYCATP